MRTHFFILVIATVLFLIVVIPYAFRAIRDPDNGDAAFKALVDVKQLWQLSQDFALAFAVYLGVVVITLAHYLSNKPRA